MVILRFFLILIAVAIAVAITVRLIAWLARPRREHIGDSSGTTASSGNVEISTSRNTHDKHNGDGHDSGSDSGSDGGGD